MPMDKPAPPDLWVSALGDSSLTRRSESAGDLPATGSGGTRVCFGLCKIFFYVEAFVHEPNYSCTPPLPTCIVNTIEIL